MNQVELFFNAILEWIRDKGSELNILGKTTGNEPQLNVLVLGETGSGKSTFVNTLTNFYRGGSLSSLRVAIPTKHLKKTEEFTSNEHDVNNTTTSKTDNCNHYKFLFEGKVYNFIDTPGLSDTRGTNKDDENLDKIIDEADKAGSLNAILIVINGTTPRMTSNLKNAFTRLRGCLPDVLFDNILVMLTNCQKHTCNFDLASLCALRPKMTFYMNNSAFSTDPKCWDETDLEYLGLEWKTSMQAIRSATEAIAGMATTTTKAFGDMKSIRFEIKQTLHGARLQIRQLQELQDHIAIAQVSLGKHSADAEKFKNYTRTKTVPVVLLVDASYHSTICSACNYVCHDHCGLDEIASQGSNAFLRCTCMGGQSQCKVCEGRCSHTTHYHARKTMRREEQTLEEVLHDMKAKYDAANQGMADKMQQITSISTAKSGVEKAIQSATVSLHNKCKELKKICSGFNLVDELHAMLMQLEAESRSLCSMEARTTANAFIRTIKQLCDSLSTGQAQSDLQALCLSSFQDSANKNDGSNFSADRGVDGEGAINTTYSEWKMPPPTSQFGIPDFYSPPLGSPKFASPQSASPRTASPQHATQQPTSSHPAWPQYTSPQHLSFLSTPPQSGSAQPESPQFSPQSARPQPQPAIPKSTIPQPATSRPAIPPVAKLATSQPARLAVQPPRPHTPQPHVPQSTGSQSGSPKLGGSPLAASPKAGGSQSGSYPAMTQGTLRVCRKCKVAFFVSQSEGERRVSKGLALPRTCTPCKQEAALVDSW